MKNLIHFKNLLPVAFLLVFFLAESYGNAQAIFGDKHIIDDNGSASELHCADINNDNITDLLALSSDHIAVYYAQGPGNFSEKETLINFPSSYNVSMFIFDFDNDQDVDILLDKTDLFLFPNDGQGNFESSETLLSSIPGDDFYVADIDNDNDADVLKTTYSESSNMLEVFLYENPGNGNLNSGTVIYDKFIPPENSIVLHFTDLQQDGDLDIMVDLYYNDWDETYNAIYSGINSNNAFDFDFVMSSSSSISIQPVDLNGDNHPDLLTLGMLNDVYCWYWYENDGNNEFENAHHLSNGSISNRLMIDADMDGDTDIVYGSYYPNERNAMSWIENDGTGFFADSYFIAAGYIYPKKSFDVDGDNDLDFLYSSYPSGIGWMENLTISK